FRNAISVECDREAVQTLKHNRDWCVIQYPIESPKAGSREILRLSKLREGEADSLIGGPPCQPFSKSGFWHNGRSQRLNDPRALTLREYLRVLRDTLPKTFLLENVPGLGRDPRHSDALQLIQRELDKINDERSTSYTFEVAQVNAAAFGVPQMRERVFLVGDREGRSFQFPSPTHRLEEETDQVVFITEGDARLPPAATAWDAIGDL